jgi:hypothetical protein
MQKCEPLRAMQGPGSYDSDECWTPSEVNRYPAETGTVEYRGTPEGPQGLLNNLRNKGHNKYTEQKPADKSFDNA